MQPPGLHYELNDGMTWINGSGPSSLCNKSNKTSMPVITSIKPVGNRMQNEPVHKSFPLEYEMSGFVDKCKEIQLPKF